VGDWPERLRLVPRKLMLAALGAVVVGVAGVAWWSLRPSTAPVEMTLPMASSAPSAATGPEPAPARGAPSAAPGAGSVGDAGSPGPTVTLTVHAAGAVAVPGLYRLPAGSRVADLVNAAGGLSGDGDADRVNLASPLNDGQRVYLPRHGEAVPAVEAGDEGVSPASDSPGGPGPGGPQAAAIVNLNTATAEQLDTLPGVGPSTAAAIIEHRRQHGPFKSPDGLLDVRGIGPAKLGEMRSRVTV
jgi:competence protein ComEA